MFARFIKRFRCQCGHWKTLHRWYSGPCVVCDCEAFVAVDEE